MKYSPPAASSHSIAHVALFAALIAAMGMIPKVDLPFGVPITLQTLPMLIRENDSMNKVLVLKAAGLVRALESEDQDEMLVCLTDKGRRAFEREQ